MSPNESPPLSPRSLTRLSTSLASNRQKRVIEEAQAKNDNILTRSKTVSSRPLEKSSAIKEPSILPPPPPKDASLSKKALKRPMDGSSKSGRHEKKNKTSAPASSQELGPASTVHPDVGAAAANSTEVLADLLRVTQGDIPNMSSSSIEDQINAGWAYALKALAIVQRNYDVLGQNSTSARISAEKAGERLTKAEQRIKYLEDRRGELTTETSSLKRKVSVLEGQVNSRDAEIGSLRRQLDSLRESWDVESRQMVAEALSDFHAKASERTLAAKERLLDLKQDFIGPCLASAEVVDPEAESALTEELIGIARLLRLPHVPSPPIEDGVKGSSLEFWSAKVGVTAQAGSNLYSSVVDALLVEKRRNETVGADISTDARHSEQGRSEANEALASQENAEAVEVPASHIGAGVDARGEEDPDKVIELPTSQEEGNIDPPQGKEGNATPLPNTDEAAVVETLKGPDVVSSKVTPTAAEVQDGSQVADQSNEVATPPAKETLNEEEKSSSGQSNIWDQIAL